MFEESLDLENQIKNRCDYPANFAFALNSEITQHLQQLVLWVLVPILWYGGCPKISVEFRLSVAADWKSQSFNQDKNAAFVTTICQLRQYNYISTWRNQKIQQTAAWNVGPRLRTNQEIKFCSHSCHVVVIMIVHVHDLFLHILKGRVEQWPNTMWKTESCNFSSTTLPQCSSSPAARRWICFARLVSRGSPFGSKAALVCENPGRSMYRSYMFLPKKLVFGIRI